MNIDETILDQLAMLQQKRLNDIVFNGEDFHLHGSEKTLRGLYDRLKGIITFPAGVGINAGATLNHKTGLVYVAALDTTKAGVVVVSVLPISGTLEVMTTRAGNYTRAGSMPVLKRHAGEIGVPAFGAPPIGTIVQDQGNLLTVSSARREGPVTVLRVQPAPVKSAPAPRTATPFRGGM